MATHSREPEGDVGVLFHGELELSSDPESRLVVTLTMEPDSLSLATGEEKLGTWNRPDAKAVEISRGKYDLTLGNETLIFTPENGPLFASRGLAYFNEPDRAIETPGLLSKIKKWGLKPTDFASQTEATQPAMSTPDPHPDRPIGPLEAAYSQPDTAKSDGPLPAAPTMAQSSPNIQPPSPTPPAVHPASPGSIEITQSRAGEPDQPGAELPGGTTRVEWREPMSGPVGTSLTEPAPGPTASPPVPPGGPQPGERPTIQMAAPESGSPSPIPVVAEPPASGRPAFDTKVRAASIPIPSQPPKPAPAHERPPVIPDIVGLLARLDS
ncbi:MAG: hypothetical protein OEM40_08185, partial [Acidimicrobiia bacterium]|nr:hypothetical protein [Acidimicrobiia bacterium]